MYILKKSVNVVSTHKLSLNYDSYSNQAHQYLYNIDVYICSNFLNPDGMVMDSDLIGNTINEYFDQENLNEKFDFAPTAENLAKWISNKFTDRSNSIICYKAVVKTAFETAVYIRPNYKDEASISF